MKKIIRVLLCWAVTFLCLAQGNAQTLTRISFNKDTLPSGAKTYVAHVKVAGFKKIIAASFAMKWDSAVISFDSVGNFGMAFNDDHFGDQRTPNGILRFVWQEGLTGVTLNDNTTLFSLYFKVIGKPGSKSPISFISITESTPTIEKEIVDSDFNIINAQYTDGLVVLRTLTSATTFASDPNKLRVNKAYPNPFNNNLTVEFTLQQTGRMNIEVVDVMGKIVHTEQRNFLAGKQELLLPKSVFPSPGNYFVRMYQGTSFTLQPVIFMQ